MTTTVTRKACHADGIKFLREAIDAADQADACFRDSQTGGQVNAPGCGSMEVAVGRMTALLRAAESATCEDCDKSIADCACYYDKAVR